MAVKLTDSIVNERLKQLGYTKLEPYVNSSSPLVVKEELSGEIFTTTWNSIQQGYRPGKQVKSRKKYTQAKVEEIFKKEGYTLLSTYEDNRTNNTLLSPSGELWNCSLSHFREGRRCNDFIGISKGELAIKTILQESDIKFHSQYCISINDDKHLFDFYIPSDSLFIEYDGIQHYEPVNHFGGKGKYKLRVEKDLAKDEYCKENNMSIIRIPYTVKGLDDIYEYLNERMDANLTRPSQINSSSYKEVASYYLEHTLENTMDKFGVSKSFVLNSFLSTYGVSKKKYTQVSRYKKPAEDYLNGKSQKYIRDKYGVDAFHAFKIIYGMSKNDYIKENIYPQAALDYLNGKSRKYVQEKYHVNAQDAFRYIYKDNIRSYRRKNKCLGK